MDVYVCVCVGRVGIFGRKSGIIRWILGVLRRMSAVCLGVEMERVFGRPRGLPKLGRGLSTRELQRGKRSERFFFGCGGAELLQ